MKRGKKIVVVAHCYLNQNARVKPYASMKGGFNELIIPLLEADFAIIQLPCPETTACGLKRWEAATEQYDTPAFRRHCRTILLPYVDQLQEHSKAGDKIFAVLGVPFSPCCGCENNPSNENWGGSVLDTEVPPLKIKNGPAIFMQELMKLCSDAKLKFDFIDVSEAKDMFPESQVDRVLKELLPMQ